MFQNYGNPTQRPYLITISRADEKRDHVIKSRWSVQSLHPIKTCFSRVSLFFEGVFLDRESAMTCMLTGQPGRGWELSTWKIKATTDGTYWLTCSNDKRRITSVLVDCEKALRRFSSSWYGSTGHWIRFSNCNSKRTFTIHLQSSVCFSKSQTIVTLNVCGHERVNIFWKRQQLHHLIFFHIHNTERVVVNNQSSGDIAVGQCRRCRTCLMLRPLHAVQLEKDITVY